MRAAVFHGPHDIRIEAIERPRPGPGEVLIRVHANGICGTDAAEYSDGPQMYPLHQRHGLTGHLGPIVPGHEFSGRIEEIGPDVEGFTVGEPVITGAALWCGACPQCRMGRTSICVAYATVGLHRHGGLAEFVCVPARIVYHAEPFHLSDDVAVLTQPMAIAVHAMRRGAPRPQEHVLVVGTGGIGAFLVYALARAGARVAAIDISPQRLEIARLLGADHTFASADQKTIGVELSRYAFAPTLVFEVSGTETGLATAIASVDPGGRVVFVGIAKRPTTIDVRRVTVKEIALIGTNALIGDEDVPEAAGLLGLDQPLWRSVAPTAIPLERLVEDGLLPMLDGRAARIKTLVDPWITAERATA